MNNENKKFIERQIKDLEETIERLNEKIDEHKLNLKDEKLYFLRNEIENNGLISEFELLENDSEHDEDVIYIAYDAVNPEISYEIDTTSNYDFWYLRIKLNDVKIGLFKIQKEKMSFKHFIEYMVKPFIVKVKYDIKENKECE